ncbi:hypothetical protein ACFVUP_37775, partial [Streptomyces bacillaris]|uniref:hypothetical protein n=1 Tax=Streptomyces bacillaris TaxID=68179 RepID=UPI0036DCFB6D
MILDGEPLPAGSFSAMTDAWRWCRASPFFAPAAVIRARVDPAREPGGRPVDCDVVARDVAELGERLSAAITHAAIEAAAGRFQLFHAAGVAHRQSGASAALIGPSGAGKSTAVLALGRQFDYLTDETVAVDRAGVVQPYRKPVSLRVDGEPWKRQLDPASVGLSRGAAARPVLRRLIVLDRRSGPTDVEVRPLDPIEAIERVLPETSHVGRLPGALTAIKRLAD